jgi:hypothetical protein
MLSTRTYLEKSGNQILVWDAEKRKNSDGAFLFWHQKPIEIVITVIDVARLSEIENVFRKVRKKTREMKNSYKFIRIV